MKIICIGRNYSDHVKEMGNSISKSPIFFLKPNSALLPKRNPFFIPNFSNEIHYEVELVYKIKKVGKSIDQSFSKNYYSEIGLGIDFTARDLQEECKKNGHPWEIAKSFDQSALVSENFMDLNSLNKLNFSLLKNGEIVQESNANKMIFNIDQIISYVSNYMTLKTGDLIFTGTPSGVGPIKIGDSLEGFINDKSMFKVNIK
ncbi:fumarylacetoacetate hydrolase family protein [Flavobacteriales bacterium]|nr:fumarylacetoacetate hydrolase family protein [Flavobacteriales bacterium]|tara:strand:- start:311 stop:916 length:606 start_codon:yes stop_codon:yes gene_type:complete